METTDEGLTINSNMVTDGFEMVFHWGYSWWLGDTSALKGFFRFFSGGFGLSSIKPSDDTSRATRQSVYGFTSRLSLISFYNENEFVVFRRSSRQTNPSGNRMLLESNHFSSGFIQNSTASSLIRTPRRSSTTVYHFFAGVFDQKPIRWGRRDRSQSFSI